MTKIAIVEDSKIVREGFASFVNADPDLKCVCTCGTAEEALDQIPKHKPDVVLMDIHLPKLSGIECTERLKQQMPGLQIIMVTVYEDPERTFKALRAGACGYLLKRSTPEELISAIHEVRQGGVPMTREIARKVIATLQKPTTAAAEVEALSARELEILELLAQGFPNKQIALRVGLSDSTVRWHLQNVYQKLHVRSRTEATVKFYSAKPGKSAL
jgi:DNA-binding NarL/FixJ family response regulator